MSLNGLDDPKVQEAHEAAVAEPGGWCVLERFFPSFRPGMLSCALLKQVPPQLLESR